MKTYDAIVIGSGVSGLSAAYGLKEAGKTVLVVEEDLWGGLVLTVDVILKSLVKCSRGT